MDVVPSIRLIKRLQANLGRTIRLIFHWWIILDKMPGLLFSKITELLLLEKFLRTIWKEVNKNQPGSGKQKQGFW